MKDFLRNVAATVVGIFALGVIMTILSVVSLIGMIASQDPVATVDDNSVLVIPLSGVMSEREEPNVLGRLGGGLLDQPGMAETLQAIRKATEMKEIRGIYLEAGAFSADYASVQELRHALADFRKAGKWIVAYGDIYTQGTYWLCSVADRVYMNPQGQVDWHGLGAEPMFVKDLLAKVGIQMQVVKVGKYKSATEMYTADKMSDPSREQVAAYIGGLWRTMCRDVAQSRKLAPATLNAYADSLITFDDQQTLVRKRMVDGLLYTDQVKGVVKKRLGLKADEEVRQVSVDDVVAAKAGKREGGQVAVYYAYGEIVDAPAVAGLFGAQHAIVGGEVCKDLEGLMDDDQVKAVVIRVNSGGGSAYASEQMWHQIQMLRKKKPVVVSMGGMAASGGYYMSCGADWIVAEPTTITGSIGIFGMIPDRSRLLTQKLGIRFDEVKTNRHATMGTSSRPMNDEELAYLTRYIDRGYSLFRQRVADGRHLTTAQVEAVAQGHVFLAQEAIQYKLVDQLGGLREAVAKAAALAKMEKYHAATYPEQPDFLSQLLAEAKGSNYLDEQLRTTLGEYYEPFVLLRTIRQMDWVQARMPYYLNIR